MQWRKWIWNNFIDFLLNFYFEEKWRRLPWRYRQKKRLCWKHFVWRSKKKQADGIFNFALKEWVSSPLPVSESQKPVRLSQTKVCRVETVCHRLCLRKECFPELLCKKIPVSRTGQNGNPVRTRTWTKSTKTPCAAITPQGCENKPHLL